MTRYRNPIIPGFYSDPSICRVGRDYYLVTSSFEYFPGVPIFHSRDLVNWKQIGYCLTRESQLPLAHARSSQGIWAATLRHHNGKFYMTTTNLWGIGHFYVTAEDPAGEWSDPIYVRTTDDTAPLGVPYLFGGTGWDPSFLFDDDGTVYFHWYVHKTGILQSVIDIETGQLLTPPRVIWTGTGAKSPEGPHLYKINGLYYIVAAEGGTEYGHMMTMGRSDSPWGPFESCPHNPILTQRSLDNPIMGAGHGDLIQAHDGSWWVVFLAFRPHGYPPVYHLGRETYLAPARWTEDGWLKVGLDGHVELEMDAPLLAPQACQCHSLRDDFDQPRFDINWNFLRNPVWENYSLSERPGFLRMTGSDITLNDIASPSMICRRQRSFDCRFSAAIEFSPLDESHEAGLVVYANDRHHYEIFYTVRSHQPSIVVRRAIGTLSAEVACVPYSPASFGSAGQIVLALQANSCQYQLGYLENERFVEIARAETRYLATEVAGCFTGVFLGLYVTGKHEPLAYFDWCDYQEFE